MASDRYDFAFFRLGRPIDLGDWMSFALDEIDAFGSPPTHIAGKKAGWVVAPKDLDKLRQKLLAAQIPAIQAGTNPHHTGAFDGWGINLSLANGVDVALARYCDEESHQDALAAWVKRCAMRLAASGDIEYGYAYSGDRPKDGTFGVGMIAGRPSARLKPLFGNEEHVSKWFRARMWGTARGYIYDVFPVNVLRREFLERMLCGVPAAASLETFGPLENLSDELCMWTIPTEEARSAASNLLAEAKCSVVGHLDGELSQVRPKAS